MMFYRRMIMIKSSKHAAGPLCIEKSLVIMPYVSLWLAWVDVCAPRRYVCWPGVGHSVNLKG